MSVAERKTPATAGSPKAKVRSSDQLAAMSEDLFDIHSITSMSASRTRAQSPQLSASAFMSMQLEQRSAKNAAAQRGAAPQGHSRARVHEPERDHDRPKQGAWIVRLATMDEDRVERMLQCAKGQRAEEHERDQAEHATAERLFEHGDDGLVDRLRLDRGQQLANLARASCDPVGSTEAVARSGSSS